MTPMLDGCPVGNFCEVTAFPEGGACGTSAEHIDSLVPAERLCVRAASYLLDQACGRPIDKKITPAPAIQAVEIGWAAVEHAMNPVVDETEAAHEIRQAIALAKSVEGDGRVSAQLAMDATLLRVYAPILNARARGCEPMHRDLQALRRALVSLFELSAQAEVHTVATHGLHFERPGHTPCFNFEQYREEMRAQLVILALARREGMLLFPTSRRESRTHAEQMSQPHSHTFYLLKNGEKCPVKIGGLTKARRTASVYRRAGSPVLLISPPYLIAQSLADSPLSLLERLSVAQISQLLCNEFKGESLSAANRERLDIIGKSFKAAIEQFAAQHIRNDFQSSLGSHETELTVLEVRWTILPAGDGGTRQAVASSGDESLGKIRKSDLTRIEKLRELIKEQGGDGYLAVSNLKQNGKFDYVVGVLPKRIGSSVLEDAVADNPEVGNAMFVFKGEHGLDEEGKVVFTWKDVFSSTKAAAKRMGAHRIVHTADAYTKLREYFEQPTHRRLPEPLGVQTAA